MNAIPTKYRGVQFRSRLEAKWAAMFDLLAWPWEYEPIDLDGYIPDFIVSKGTSFGAAHLFEVKPIVDWSPGEDLYVEAIDKIERSGWKGPAVILGATHPAPGCIAHSFIPGDHLRIFGSRLGFCDDCRNVQLSSSFTTCWQHGTDLAFFNGDVYWREAGNRVQWRSPR